MLHSDSISSPSCIQLDARWKKRIPRRSRPANINRVGTNITSDIRPNICPCFHMAEDPAVGSLVRSIGVLHTLGTPAPASPFQGHAKRRPHQILTAFRSKFVDSSGITTIDIPRIPVDVKKSKFAGEYLRPVTKASTLRMAPVESAQSACAGPQ